MTGGIHGAGGDAAAKAAAAQDAAAAKATAKADTAAVKQDVAAERFMDALADRAGLLKQDKAKKEKKELGKQKPRVQKGQEAKAEKEGAAGGEKSQKADHSKIKRALNRFGKGEKGKGEEKLKRLVLKYIKDGDTATTILNKVDDLYESRKERQNALNFLKEVTVGELQEKVSVAIDELERRKEETIQPSRDIAAVADQLKEKGITNPTFIDDLFDEIVHNPADARKLFFELDDRFSYQEITEVSKELYTRLGEKLKDV